MAGREARWRCVCSGFPAFLHQYRWVLLKFDKFRGRRRGLELALAKRRSEKAEPGKVERKRSTCVTTRVCVINTDSWLSPFFPLLLVYGLLPPPEQHFRRV